MLGGKRDGINGRDDIIFCFVSSIITMIAFYLFIQGNITLMGSVCGK